MVAVGHFQQAADRQEGVAVGRVRRAGNPGVRFLKPPGHELEQALDGLGALPHQIFQELLGEDHDFGKFRGFGAVRPGSPGQRAHLAEYFAAGKTHHGLFLVVLGPIDIHRAFLDQIGGAPWLAFPVDALPLVKGLHVGEFADHDASLRCADGNPVCRCPQ